MSVLEEAKLPLVNSRLAGLEKQLGSIESRQNETARSLRTLGKSVEEVLARQYVKDKAG